MVRILAVQQIDMQSQAAMLRQRPQEFFNQAGIEGADFLIDNWYLVVQERPI